MAESGQLQALHQSCTDLFKAVETGYIKVMDQLDRIIQQISESEQDIYNDLIETDITDLKRINNAQHGKSIFDALSLASRSAHLENYEIVRRVAEDKGDSDVVNAAKSLK